MTWVCVLHSSMSLWMQICIQWFVRWVNIFVQQLREGWIWACMFVCNQSVFWNSLQSIGPLSGAVQPAYSQTFKPGWFSVGLSCNFKLWVPHVMEEHSWSEICCRFSDEVIIPQIQSGHEIRCVSLKPASETLWQAFLQATTWMDQFGKCVQLGLCVHVYVYIRIQGFR